MSPVQTVTYVSGSDSQKMAETEVVTSNSLFETLEDWNRQLKAENHKLNQIAKAPLTPRRRGPSP